MEFSYLPPDLSTLEQDTFQYPTFYATPQQQQQQQQLQQQVPQTHQQQQQLQYISQSSQPQQSSSSYYGIDDFSMPSLQQVVYPTQMHSPQLNTPLSASCSTSLSSTSSSVQPQQVYYYASQYPNYLPQAQTNIYPLISPPLEGTFGDEENSLLSHMAAQRSVNVIQNDSSSKITKRRSSGESNKRCKISGTVYNSSAVFQRLKSSDKVGSFESNPVSSVKSQGRPFSNNFNCRVLLHSSIKGLLAHVDKRSDNKFIVYDWEQMTNTETNTGFSYPELVSLINNKDIDLMSLDDFEIDDQARFEPNDFDQLLKFNNNTSRAMVTNAYGSIGATYEDLSPVSVNVKYDPIKWTKTDDQTLNSQLLSMDIDDDLIYSSCNNGKVINFHKMVIQKFNFNNESGNGYMFVKPIRDNNGQVLKLESLKPPVNSRGIIEYTPEWIKRFVCYPRYKSGMNIQLIKCTEEFTLYNDYKMLIWDIKEKLKQLDLEFNELTTDDIRTQLFNNKTVYINTGR